jgi:hypothetical protein
MKKTTFWALGLLALILVIVVSIFYYKEYRSMHSQSETIPNSSLPTNSGQQNTSTSIGWQSYNNEQYGFSIQYPDTWKVLSEGTSTSDGTLGSYTVNFGMINTDSSTKSEFPTIYDAAIEIYPATASETPLEAYQQTNSYFDLPGTATSSIMVAGTPAIEYNVPGEVLSWEALIIHENNLYGLIQFTLDNQTFAVFANSLRFDN